MLVNIINNPKSLGGNRGVLAAAEQLLKDKKTFALAIVTNTKGSTYRKSGALALFADDKITQSVISGGCLESSWHKAASEVIARNEPQSILLDTQSDDDLIFGSGSGCRGSMRVLIIPVLAENAHPLYSAIVDAHQRHQELKVALILDPPYCAQGLAWNEDRQWQFGGHVDEIKFMKNVAHGEQLILLSNKQVTVAVFNVRPAPQILLIGASVETPYLIRMARTLGWHVTVIDHRQAQTEQHAIEADKIIPSRPNVALINLTHTFDAALIMSHSASTDLEALQSFATRNERYVGLLGPPARRDELLSQLNETKRSSLVPRLHAPLGLRLGGDGPESVALSITAELQQFFHNE